MMQKLAAEQETPERAKPVEPATLVSVQTPPAGLVEVATLPPPSMATQKLAVGQETEVRPSIEPERWVIAQAEEPPVGWEEATTLPAWSTATQRLLEAQEMAGRALEPSKMVCIQATGKGTGEDWMTGLRGEGGTGEDWLTGAREAAGTGED